MFIHSIRPHGGHLQMSRSRTQSHVGPDRSKNPRMRNDTTKERRVRGARREAGPHERPTESDICEDVAAGPMEPPTAGVGLCDEVRAAPVNGSG